MSEALNTEPTDWRPTRKWYALVSTGVAGIAASVLVTGAFDAVERGMAGTLLTTAVAAYWTRNSVEDAA